MVSNAADTPAFVEMTRWYVRGMHRTHTPYLFMTMNDAQCQFIQQIIDETLGTDTTTQSPAAAAAEAAAGTGK